MALPSVLVLSPDPEVQQYLTVLLAKCGLATISASTVSEAQNVPGNDLASIILSFEELPDGGLSDLLRLSKKGSRKVPLILFSPFADWEGYLRTVRAGAFDYVRYPPVRGEIERVVQNALSQDSVEHVKRASAPA